jgi:hypothetical protein
VRIPPDAVFGLTASWSDCGDNRDKDRNASAAAVSDVNWRTGDPGGQQYRYVSDGNLYGLLIKLENGNGKIPPGGLCLTGVGTKGSGLWGGPPDCPF